MAVDEEANIEEIWPSMKQLRGAGVGDEVRTYIEVFDQRCLAAATT